MYNMTNTKDINNIKQLILWKIKALLIVRQCMIRRYQNRREGYRLIDIMQIDNNIKKMAESYDEVLAQAAAMSFKWR